MIRNIAVAVNSQFKKYIYNQYGQNYLLSRKITTSGEKVHTETSDINVQCDDLDKLYSNVELEVKCADPELLKSYEFFVTSAAISLGMDVGKCWARRKSKKDRLILLKSVHIYKKHRVQYEIRTYFRFMKFHKLTGSTLATFLEYIERNLPEGIAMKVSKTEMQSLPAHLSSIPQKSR